MIGYIDVTGVPLETIVRAAYNPSRPQGLGHLHFQPGDLTDEEVSAIIGRFADSPITAVGMDYVKGRSVKMTVRKRDGRHLIPNRWYDHGDSALRQFLTTIGLSPDLLDKARAEEHAHMTECTSAAIEFLQANGGRFAMPHNFEAKDLPPKVYDGLYYGIDLGKTKSDFNDSEQVWKLVA